MKQAVQKILLLVAVFTVTAHSIIPHYHHDEVSIVATHHHHEEKKTTDLDHHPEKNGDHHNIFSFAQLDENYVPVNSQNNSFELPLTYLSAFLVTYLSDDFPVNTKTHFGCYKEFPPPEKYFPSSSHRGPPAV